MLKFFAGNQYSDPTQSDDLNNARLACHLAFFLQEAQSLRGTERGAWLSNINLAETLRQTCHALEGLYALQWHEFDTVIELGLRWLIMLSGNHKVRDDTQPSLRLAPSRFKTLAWLNKLQNAKVRKEFDELSRYVTDDGLLNNASVKPILAGMIFVDTVTHIESNDVPPRWKSAQDSVLARLEMELMNWHAGSRVPDWNVHVSTISDASYALDLLLRTGRIRLADDVSQRVCQAMLNTLRSAERRDVLPIDAVYSAIQLGAHFQHSDDVQRALRQFYCFVRKKYDRDRLGRVPQHVHALILRGLAAWQRQQLSQDVFSLLLGQHRTSLRQHRESLSRRHEDIFQKLMKERIRVHVVEWRPVSGGITEAEIFRVKYEVGVDSVYHGDDRKQPKLNPPSIIVKRGNRPSLEQAVARYRELPDGVKHYFAQHEGDSKILEVSPSAPAYLILEDLTDDYITVHDLFEDLEGPRLSNQDRGIIHAIGAGIARALQEIFLATKQKQDDVAGLQLARLYLSPLEQHLVNLRQSGQYPHLKTFVEGFRLDNHRFDAIRVYLEKLYHYRNRFHAPWLSLIHGDCHSRNIMIDSCFAQIKFIDLDKIRYDGDYVFDYAQLLEDIAIFRMLFGFVFDHETSYQLPREEVKLGQSYISYSPCASEAVQHFQLLLMGHLRQFASQIDDQHWQARLWLAIAVHIIGLIKKHTENEQATVLYVEGVKLLDQLVQHLEFGTPLPAIPFTDVHQVTRSGAAASPFPAPEHEYLRRLHQQLVTSDRRVRAQIGHANRIVRYSLDTQELPFAILTAKHNRWALFFACHPSDIQNHQGLHLRTKRDLVFQTVLSVGESQEIQAIISVVEQVIAFRSV